MNKLTFAALLLIACAPLALAQGTYTQIDAPGAAFTWVQSIDASGDVVGYYADASGYHGFLLSDGAYTIVNYPGAEYTYLYGLNDVGQIVGLAGNSLGFLYDVQGETFTTVNFPHASQTFPYAINNAGMIAGTIQYGGFFYGFTDADSQYSRVEPTGTDEIFVSTLTSSGAVVGNAVNKNSGVNDFFLFNGRYKQLTIPNAPGGLLNGVNPAGTAVVGYYTPSSGVTAGFVYQNKTLTTLQFPGSENTIASGINAAEEVVGTFVDSSGVQHGFTWTPPAAEEKK